VVRAQFQTVGSDHQQSKVDHPSVELPHKMQGPKKYPKFMQSNTTEALGIEGRPSGGGGSV
jgi:hypothetical protein